MMDLSNVKLICMDMDGTLFAGGETVPERNLKALRECARRGIHLALVSGRNFRFLMKAASGIVPEMAIVSANGARIDECAGGRCIYEETFSPEEAIRVSRILYDANVYYEAYTKKVNFAFRRELITPVHKRSLERYIANHQIIGCTFPERPEDADYEGIFKFVAFSDDPNVILRVRRALDYNGFIHSSSAAENVETMAPGVGKGKALCRLAEYYGIAKEDTMAFGDYTNDIDMLKASGHPVAMSNGVDEVKAVARIIAPPNTEGGVGQVIEQYVLHCYKEN